MCIYLKCHTSAARMYVVLMYVVLSRTLRAQYYAQCRVFALENVSCAGSAIVPLASSCWEGRAEMYRYQFLPNERANIQGFSPD